MIRPPGVIRALAVVCAVVLGPGGGTPAVWAQTATPAASEQDQGPPDYAAWERTAKKAERQTQDRQTPDDALTTMRGYLVEWRATFQAAQNVNAARIATLRAQIDALGPPPADGKLETEAIALRRTELNDQLAQLQTPVIAADEAFRRADGLIKEIDRQLRERQADELLKVTPMPINPANWGIAVKALRDISAEIWNEVQTRWARPEVRADFTAYLPLALILFIIGLGLIWRGWSLGERLGNALSTLTPKHWHPVWGIFASLGQVALPVIGFVLIGVPIQFTGVLGPIGSHLAVSLAGLGVVIFGWAWLGQRIFPKDETEGMLLNLSPEKRAEGRFYSLVLGALTGFQTLFTVMSVDKGIPVEARAILSFPSLVLFSVVLLRIGRLLRDHARSRGAADALPSFRDRLIGLFGQAAVAIAVTGPILAAFGYAAAASALVYPAVFSLGLLGVLFVLLDVVDGLYALIVRRTGRPGDALVPTLIGFALSLACLPLFALIWGARISDLSELWTSFLAGFSIGETQISPRGFLTFAVVFAIGYMMTRLFQGALGSSVLPKTKMDQGGRNAVVAGVGYIGIFLSALSAINAAGINLAGLAIVAGALSVGIGFGLQNIVSNFVSGIILLIERPVSEGDWIEVGGVQGVVKTISVRSTRIQTFDRTDVIVPNTDLIAGRVTNWTRYNLTGRLIVPVAVAVGADNRKVERVLMEIAEAEPLAVLNPPPTVLLMGFTPDALLFEIRIILRDVNFQLSVRSDINHRILQRFHEEGIGLSLSVAAQAQLKPVGDGADEG